MTRCNISMDALFNPTALATSQGVMATPSRAERVRDASGRLCSSYGLKLISVDASAMSRLPRLHSSTNTHQAGPSQASTSKVPMLNSRKRKATDDEPDDTQNRPKKLPAIAENGNNQPLRPSKVLPNRAAVKGKAPVLPVPKATTAAGPATRRTTRATTAPQKSEPARPPPVRGTMAGARGAARGGARGGARGTTGRPVAAPLRGKAAEEARFAALQEQVTSIESARAADAARIAAVLEAEQKKLEGLQSDHQNLTKELADARAQEMNQRRELVTVNDELEALKRKHANEIMDLEMEIKKKEREIRELKEDLRLCQEDLDRERDSVKTLKSTVSQQSTTQLTLTTQVSALQAQLSALQSALDMSCNSSSQLKLELESERKRVAELEDENRAAEALRRKLHNMVQELKVCLLPNACIAF